MIDGVKITRPGVIGDDRGAVMRMLRSDDAHFAGFGEIYFSVVNGGAVKAWKRHREMVMNLAVISGKALLVLYDDRAGSPTFGRVQQVELGDQDYLLVTVPPMIWNGFMGLGSAPSILANCASILHRPDEADRLDAGSPDIPFAWPRSVSE